VALVLTLLAALGGVFGGGPLSPRAVETAGLRVEYERFVRHRAPAALSVRLGPMGGRPEPLGIWLDADYLEAVDLQRVSPSPEAVVHSGDRILYLFRTAPETPAVGVTFAFRPQRLGVQRTRVGRLGGATVGFRQLVYP
jgi:hypothetical protein